MNCEILNDAEDITYCGDGLRDSFHSLDLSSSDAVNDTPDCFQLFFFFFGVHILFFISSIQSMPTAFLASFNEDVCLEINDISFAQKSIA